MTTLATVCPQQTMLRAGRKGINVGFIYLVFVRVCLCVSCLFIGIYWQQCKDAPGWRLSEARHLHGS